MTTLAASVADTLLNQFLAFAQLCVDRGDAPQDASYEKALQGLQVAAAQLGPSVVDRLMGWRDGSLRATRAERSELYSRRKMLVTDAVVLEGVVFLARADLGLLAPGILPKLEHLALDWLLEQAAYVEPRFLPELGQLKDRVLLVVSELLGCVSITRLDSVTEQFLLAMGRRIKADAGSPSRQQLYWLLHGMRFVQLRGDTPEQLRASWSFLDRAHPLKHVATDKKSRLQQAIAEMLTAVLSQLLEQQGGDTSKFGEGCDAPLHKQWTAAVTTLRTDLLKWVTKQSKQVLSGLPCVTALTCIEEEGQLVQCVEALVETLHKQLKDRRNASMAVQCLALLVGTFLRRMAGSGRISGDKLAKWADWAVAPVVQSMVRGGLPAPEQQELVRQLIVRVSPHLPELSVRMCLDLMAAADAGSGNWDAAMAGIMGLLSLLTAVPAKLTKLTNVQAGGALELSPAAALGLERPSSAGVWLPPAEASRSLLDLIKLGYNPLEAYGVPHLLPRVSQALARLLQTCHSQYGHARLTNPAARAVSDAVTRERASVLPVFVMGLQCVPCVLPDTWADGKGFGDLLDYTAHIELPMRQVSTAVLRRILKALPQLRDALIGSAATYTVRIQEDYVEVIKDSVNLLLSLLREWGALAAAERAAGGRGEAPASAGGGQSMGSSLHRVEGAALSLLCSNDVGVRRLAVELLQSARELHQALTAARQPGSSRRLTAESSAAAQHFRPATAASGAAGPPPRRASQQSSVGLESVPSTPGSIGVPDLTRVVYAADVLDRSGNAVAQRCYWDFGRWSDLWRAWRPLPAAGVSFDQCLQRASHYEDAVRWARLLCDLMKEVWRRCEVSAAVAHSEMTSKLQGLLTLDSSGRSVLPPDAKLDLARAYCLALAAAPLAEATERVTRDFVRMLVATARSGTEGQQQVAVLGLGHAHASCHALVAGEAAALVEEYGERGAQRSLSGVPMVGSMSRASRARKDDLRLTHAHILRLVADNLPSGSLLRNYVLPETRKQGNAVRDRLVLWVRDAYTHITTVSELSVEGQQLRHCLACVARHCSLQLADAMPQAFDRDLRRKLFDLFSLWCEEGQPGGQFKAELRRSITSLRQRLKDVEAGRQLETDLADSSEVLEHVAYLGMAAMLNGPMFAVDVRNPEGQVFSWAGRMLSAPRLPEGVGSRGGAWGPPKGAVARSGLKYLLQSNPSLAPVFVDKAYVRNPNISAGYFQVLSEVYASQELPVAPQVLVSLVLHRVVDPRQEVRDAARSLLGVLSKRAWGRESRFSSETEPGSVADMQLGAENGSAAAAAASAAGSSSALVVGVLHDSQQAHQQRLSARLARDHADLAEALAQEVLARQLDNESGPEVLLCLCPWLAHITLGRHLENRQTERLLHLIYKVTATQGKKHAYQVQRLWATLGSSRRNVGPILDFLVERSLQECATDQSETPCAVGKAVTLYLSRVAARATIDHLAQELAQQMSEESDEDGHAADTPQAGTPKILEFHHARNESTARQSTAALSSGVSMTGGSRPTTPLAGAPGSMRGTASGLLPLMKSHSAWSESSFTSSAAGGAGGAAGSGGGDGWGGGGANEGGGGGGQQQQDPPDSPRRSGDIGRVATPELGGALTRPELALCLLSELAYEHDEEFRRHLPTLLQVITLNADSPKLTVRQECAQLLTYLLYSLACKHLEAHVAGGAASLEYRRVSKLIARLQSLRGQPLWAREQPSLAQPYVASAIDVTAFVQTVVECFYFDTALRERWCTEALRWACGSHSRHFASRAHQVFCALSPALSSTSCTAMLTALHKCLQSPSTQSLDTAVEMLCTLRALLANLAPGKALLFPHLLLAAVALLHSSVVRVGELAMHILLQVLSQLDLTDPTVQQTLLALLPADEDDPGGDENAPTHNTGPTSPSSDQGSAGSLGSGGSARSAGAGALAAKLWPLGQGLFSGVRDVSEDLGPWMALPQLAVKALFRPETELLAVEVLASLARQVAQAPSAKQCRAAASGFPDGLLFSSLTLADSLLGEGATAGVSGLGSVLGDVEVGVAVTLGAVLPWLWVHLADEATGDTAAALLEALSGACGAAGWCQLAAVVAALAGMAGLDAEPAALLAPLCEAVTAALFPTYARLVLGRLLEVVQRGSEQWQAAAVAVLQIIFEVPGLELGEASWLSRDARFISVLSSRVDSPLGPRVLELFQAMMRWQGAAETDSSLEQQRSPRESLEWGQCMDDLGESNKLCIEGLSRVLEACPDTGRQLGLGLAGAPSSGNLLPFLQQ